MSIIKESLGELLVDPKTYTARVPLPDPRQLKIYDTTLRDGEQTPGVAMSPEQKYRLAREVSDLGCHVIDICFPVVSASEHRLLELACRGRRKGELRADLEIVVMCRAAAKDIDTTLGILRKAGFSADEITFLLFSSTSDLHIKYKLGPMLLSREGLQPRNLRETPLAVLRAANKRMVVEAIQYARQRGVKRIEFGGEDASRTPVEQLIDLTRAAVDAGACRYVFADTTGSLTPESTRFYCSTLTAAFPDIELVSHFHDDFGLAAANTIVGVLNGFTTFTTTLNGIGERAGNAPLHSVVAALKYLYGLEIPGFRYDRLQVVKELVEAFTGIPVQAKEPVIGRNVFTHESGIHTHGIDVLRAMYEPMPFNEVGGKARFLYGKHSGTANLAGLLKGRQGEIGGEIDSDFILEVLAEVKVRRESMISETETHKSIAQYYKNLDSLGFTEDQVVAIARQIQIRKEAACHLTAA
jgi:methanogen homocitrate synthase